MCAFFQSWKSMGARVKRIGEKSKRGISQWGEILSEVSMVFCSKSCHTALFHQTCFMGRQLKYTSTIWVDMKTKNVAHEKLIIKHPQTPLLLSRKDPRGPDMRLSQHYTGPKMTLAWQKSSCTFCTILGVVICKNHLSKPLDSFNKY